MNNKADYLKYVKEVLKTIPKNQAKASYDTGHGIHIVSENLGNSPMTIFVVNCSLGKVKPPVIVNSDEWDQAWSQGKALIRKFIEGVR